MQSLPLATTAPPLTRLEAPIRPDMAALAATTVATKGIAPTSFESVFEGSETSAPPAQPRLLDASGTDVDGEKDAPDTPPAKLQTPEARTSQARSPEGEQPKAPSDQELTQGQDLGAQVLAAASTDRSTSDLPKTPRQPRHALEQQLTSESELLRVTQNSAPMKITQPVDTVKRAESVVQAPKDSAAFATQANADTPAQTPAAPVQGPKTPSAVETSVIAKTLTSPTEQRAPATTARLPTPQVETQTQQAKIPIQTALAGPSLPTKVSTEAVVSDATPVTKAPPFGADLAPPAGMQVEGKATASPPQVQTPPIRSAEPKGPAHAADTKALAKAAGTLAPDMTPKTSAQMVVVKDKTSVAPSPIRTGAAPEQPRAASDTKIAQTPHAPQNDSVKQALKGVSAASTLPLTETPKEGKLVPMRDLEATQAIRTEPAKAAAALGSVPVAHPVKPNTADRQATRMMRDTTAQPMATAPRLTMTTATTTAPVQWVAQSQPILTEKTLSERNLADPVFTTSRAEAPSHQHSTQAPARTELPAQTVRQLAEVVSHMPSKPVEITLSPEELGRVRLTVRASDAGVVVHLLADRPETLDLMRRNIDQLGQDFEALGYENIAFSFADSSPNTDSDESNTQDGNADAAPFLPTDPLPDTPQINLNNLASSGLDMRL